METGNPCGSSLEVQLKEFCDSARQWSFPACLTAANAILLNNLSLHFNEKVMFSIQNQLGEDASLRVREYGVSDMPANTRLLIASQFCSLPEDTQSISQGGRTITFPVHQENGTEDYLAGPHAQEDRSRSMDENAQHGPPLPNPKRVWLRFTVTPFLAKLMRDHFSANCFREVKNGYAIETYCSPEQLLPGGLFFVRAKEMIDFEQGRRGPKSAQRDNELLLPPAGELKAYYRTHVGKSTKVRWCYNCGTQIGFGTRFTACCGSSDLELNFSCKHLFCTACIAPGVMFSKPNTDHVWNLRCVECALFLATGVRVDQSAYPPRKVLAQMDLVLPDEPGEDGPI